MSKLAIAVTAPLTPPPEGAELVLFCDPKNYIPEYGAAKMLASASRYAKRHGVYLLPGRFIAGDHLCLCLFGPDGVPLGVQRATHLNLDYRGRFRRADSIEPFSTPFGRVALLVDVDVNMPQVSRAAAAKGAELLLSSQFIQLFDFYEDRIRYGAVNAARSNGVTLAAAVAGGGVVVSAAGELLAGYSEELPLLCTAEIAPPQLDLELVDTGRRLLDAHSELLFEETGGVPVV